MATVGLGTKILTNMEIKKDVQTVLFSFGAIAFVLGIGASAYYVQPPVVAVPDEIAVEAPVEEVPVVAPPTETAVIVSDDMFDDESDIDDDIPVVVPKKTAPVNTVTPTPVVEPKPVVTEPVVTAPVVVAPTPVVVATPTPVVATPTPVVKPSRKSHAS